VRDIEIYSLKCITNIRHSLNSLQILLTPLPNSSFQSKCFVGKGKETSQLSGYALIWRSKN